MTILTDEQKAIVRSYKTSTSPYIHIQALAGSGKTFTTLEIAKEITAAHPGCSILYLVYNAANRAEAAAKFSILPNVDVRTAHSFAYLIWCKKVGSFKAIDKLGVEDIKPHVWDNKNPEIKWSKYRIFHQMMDEWTEKNWGIELYCKQLLEKCNTQSMHHLIETKRGIEKRYGYMMSNGCVIIPGHVGCFMNIVKSCIENKRYTHDMYLKAAALLPELPHFKYNIILFDEAQDANKHMLSLVEKLPAYKKYFIGDPNQAIYQFNGCINAFDETEGDVYTLSQSFRFGQEIADVSAKVCGIHMTGTKQPEKDVNRNKKTILCRTNAGILEKAMDLAVNNEDIKISYMAGSSLSCNPSYYTQQCSLKHCQQDALFFFSMMLKEDKRYVELEFLHKTFETNGFEIRKTPMFEPILELMKDSKNSKSFKACLVILKGSISPEIQRFHNIYDKCGADIVKIFSRLVEAENKQTAEHDILLCTAHKSKGLEWDYVEIYEDFTLVDEAGKRVRTFNDEMNLVYVALTRGRYILDARGLYHQLVQAQINITRDELFVDSTANELAIQ